MKERSYALPSNWYSRDPSENAEQLSAMRKAQARKDERDRVRKSRRNKKTVKQVKFNGGGR